MLNVLLQLMTSKSLYTRHRHENAVCLSVCLCLSVTRWHCVKTAKFMIELLFAAKYDNNFSFTRTKTWPSHTRNSQQGALITVMTWGINIPYFGQL